MYGEDDDSGAEDGRPLSFIASTHGGDQLDNRAQKSALDPSEERLRLVRTISDQNSSASQGTKNAHGHPNALNGNPSTLRKTHTLPARIPSQRSTSFDGPKSPLPPVSPTPSMREGSQFPITNIDNPNDIAQEFTNLQALRRMSMDVGNNSDPDLVPFSTMSLVAMPSIAPTGDDDEADPSRLLWVPARVHPELEPTAFKNFLENRVQSMKRRSGDSMFSGDGVQRANSTNLRRKKSMLSRQVRTTDDSSDGYVDGADRLERQHSLRDYSTPELTLDELVKDPTKAVQRLTLETRAEEGEPDVILPVAPGMGLRRSTRTQYRKGGSVRVPFAKRVASRHGESNEEPPPIPPFDPALGQALKRTNSEPAAENYSRPTRSIKRQQNFSRDNAVPPLDTTAVATLDGSEQDEFESPLSPSPPPLLELPVRTSSAASQRAVAPPVPQIIETPPVEAQPSRKFPERSSSQNMAPQIEAEQPAVEAPPIRSAKRPTLTKPKPAPAPVPASSPTSPNAKEPPTEKESSDLNHPSALPGGGAATTSSLTFIPTFTNDQKLDKKPKDNDTESISSTKSGWKWFKSNDKEKNKREKEKEKEREEQAKKAKGKSGEKSHDTARLDVLQSSIDNVPKGRESLLLDRDSIDNKLNEERKKETARKASDSKKEKDGFFGGLFGGSRKKGDKEPGQKKKEGLRPLTPEPPPRQLRPDHDYPWTRFPIIEERAIYRMAHIKLANPRRPLHSQVLLSNFMYSYLAKVQAMHPSLNVPISPQQKRQEEERKRREAEQAALQLQMEQQMAQQQGTQDGNFDYEYHRSGNQYGDSASQHDGGSVQYVDDAQIYEYEHGRDHQDGGGSPTHQNGQEGYGQGRSPTQQQRNGGQDYYYDGRDNRQYGDDDDESSDMW
ncbi:hypothetical protein B0T17DRAFT_491406 [Bombardia bombarda]|uniref:Protein Zds1 C-terminal domain-containing protein n=1 Tax=Bombardia bombarda TaxID=252184 RepID=A0AA39X9G2_9PEZI|nr:hypothetical protein B0T17DRAFT_491406 [Bombardia bombarda]